MSCLRFRTANALFSIVTRQQIAPSSSNMYRRGRGLLACRLDAVLEPRGRPARTRYQARQDPIKAVSFHPQEDWPSNEVAGLKIAYRSEWPSRPPTCFLSIPVGPGIPTAM
nr:unnamed protein product [Digitaria exilis]